MIVITVRFAVRPEWTERFLDLTADFTAATRAEPGNLWFDWSRSVTDPNEFVLLEAFRDGEAGGAHVQSEHFQRATQELPQALAATPRILNTEMDGTDWGRMGEMQVD